MKEQILEKKLFSFSKALEFAKMGNKIWRENWDGKDMYVTLKPGYPNGIACNKATAKAHGIPEKDIIKYLPYLEMKTMYGEFVPWTPAQPDLFVDDWEVCPITDRKA